MQIRLTLPALHQGQLTIVRGAKRYNVVCCGRRFGKSVLARDRLIETALQGLPCAYFAPTYVMLKEFWNETLEILRPVIKKSLEQDRRIELVTGGYIKFWSLDSKDSCRGNKYARVVVDEAAWIRKLEDAWTSAIRPTLADYRGDAWFFSTPRGRNYFHTLFLHGRNGREGWGSWQMPTSTNPSIDKQEITAAQEDLPDYVFSQEFLAEFLENNAANPFGYQNIENCLIDYVPDEPIAVMGTDPASRRDNTAVIGLSQSGKVVFFDLFKGDWNLIEERLVDTIGDMPCLIDSTGVGRNVADQLRVRIPYLDAFPFTLNSKYQLMQSLVYAVQRQKILIPRQYEALIDELKDFEYEYTANGNVSYKARSGCHDDCCMALALALRHLNEQYLSAPSFTPF